MKANFVLVAMGSATTPRLNSMILEDHEEHAKKIAKEQVGQLSRAGYFNFTLFDVRVDEKHVLICSFSVEQPAPIVTIR